MVVKTRPGGLVASVKSNERDVDDEHEKDADAITLTPRLMRRQA